MSEIQKVALVAFTDKGLVLGKTIQKEFYRSKLFTTRETDFSKDILKIEQVADLLEKKFHAYDVWIFIGALGICVRSIAPYLQDKTSDPAVVNIDEQGKFAQAVLGGHVGGANAVAEQLSRILQGQAVISTASDLQQLWALDMLPQQFGWTAASKEPLNTLISTFVNNKRTALLLQVKDAGTPYLEKTKPPFVDLYYHLQEIDQSAYELLIYVGYEILETTIPQLAFHPKCLVIGSGCSKDIEPQFFEEVLLLRLQQEGIAYQSIAALASVDIKKEEGAYLAIAEKLGWRFETFSSEELSQVNLANPSAVVLDKIGI